MSYIKAGSGRFLRTNSAVSTVHINNDGRFKRILQYITSVGAAQRSGPFAFNALELAPHLPLAVLHQLLAAAAGQELYFADTGPVDACFDQPTIEVGYG